MSAGQIHEVAEAIRKCCNQREHGFEIAEMPREIRIHDRGHSVVLRLGVDQQWVVLQPCLSHAREVPLVDVLRAALAGASKGEPWAYREPSGPPRSTPWKALGVAGLKHLGCPARHGELPAVFLRAAADAIVEGAPANAVDHALGQCYDPHPIDLPTLRTALHALANYGRADRVRAALEARHGTGPDRPTFAQIREGIAGLIPKGGRSAE